MSCDARDTVGGGKSLVKLWPSQKLLILIQAKVAKEHQMGFKKTTKKKRKHKSSRVHGVAHMNTKQ